jgi:hypothetical protein
MWYLYRTEFYSVTKKNEILSFARKWMDLENRILHGVSQAQKAKNIMFLTSYVNYKPGGIGKGKAT